MLELDLAGSKVKLELDVLAPSCLVDADRGQMEQVFTNLVINAAQAMTEGGHLFIKIETAEFKEQQWSLKPGQYIHVQIRDEGAVSKKNISTRFLTPISVPKTLETDWVWLRYIPLSTGMVAGLM